MNKFEYFKYSFVAIFSFFLALAIHSYVFWECLVTEFDDFWQLVSFPIFVVFLLMFFALIIYERTKMKRS